MVKGSFRILFSAIACLILTHLNGVAQDKNWTHFRGSNLNSISASGDVPLKWDSTTIKWKSEIHGKGYSSPVVYDNQIWMTTGTPDGKELYEIGRASCRETV